MRDKTNIHWHIVGGTDSCCDRINKAVPPACFNTLYAHKKSMNKDQIHDALNAGLQSPQAPRLTQSLTEAIIDRVLSTLDLADPKSAAFVAELKAWAEQGNEDSRRNRLGIELWDDRKNADLTYVRRNPKTSYIYEYRLFWWASREVLFQTTGDSEDEQWHYSKSNPFEVEPPQLSNDPKKVYLDRLNYNVERNRFQIEQIPEISEWCDKNISREIFKCNLLNNLYFRAMPFPESKARELQALAASVQEFYIPGFPDVREFRLAKKNGNR